MADDALHEPVPMEYFGSRPYDYEEILHYRPRPTRRLFAGYSPALLQEMNDAIAQNWDCGICSETAKDPCVTRCGHLFCQKCLLQWFESNLSCPRCKIPCTPSADAMPVFARDWASPFMPPRSPSPLPPGQESLSPSGRSSSLSSRFTPTYEISSGSLTPTRLPGFHSSALYTDSNRSSSRLVREDTTVLKSLKKSPSTASLPPLHNDSPRHPLAASEIVAHYGGIMLRILGLLILLFALLR